MDNPIEEHYSNRKNCMTELCQARKVFTTVDALTTVEKYNKMEESLAFMYCYCPEDIMDLVIATLNEAVIRKPFILKDCEKQKQTIAL